MHRTYWIAVALAVVLPQQAGAVSEKVRKACRDDYMTHCNTLRWGATSSSSACGKAGRKLSRSCVDALVEAGEISRKEVEDRRASGH